MPKKLAIGGIFSGAIIALGVAIVLSGLIGLHSADAMRTANWAMLALVTTGLRIRAPKGGNQDVSLNFIFILLSIVQLSFEETVLLAGATAAIQVAIHLHRGSLGERSAPVLRHIGRIPLGMVMSPSRSRPSSHNRLVLRNQPLTRVLQS